MNAHVYKSWSLWPAPSRQIRNAHQVLTGHCNQLRRPNMRNIKFMSLECQVSEWTECGYRAGIFLCHPMPPKLDERQVLGWISPFQYQNSSMPSTYCWNQCTWKWYLFNCSSARFHYWQLPWPAWQNSLAWEYSFHPKTLNTRATHERALPKCWINLMKPLCVKLTHSINQKHHFSKFTHVSRNESRGTLLLGHLQTISHDGNKSFNCWRKESWRGSLTHGFSAKPRTFSAPIPPLLTIWFSEAQMWLHDRSKNIIGLVGTIIEVIWLLCRINVANDKSTNGFMLVNWFEDKSRWLSAEKNCFPLAGTLLLRSETGLNHSLAMASVMEQLTNAKYFKHRATPRIIAFTPLSIEWPLKCN